MKQSYNIQNVATGELVLRDAKREEFIAFVNNLIAGKLNVFGEPMKPYTDVNRASIMLFNFNYRAFRTGTFAYSYYTNNRTVQS